MQQFHTTQLQLALKTIMKRRTTLNYALPDPETDEQLEFSFFSNVPR